MKRISFLLIVFALGIAGRKNKQPDKEWQVARLGNNPPISSSESSGSSSNETIRKSAGSLPDSMSPLVEIPLESNDKTLGDKNPTKMTIYKKKGVSFQTRDNKTFCVVCIGKPLKGYKINA